MGMLSLNWNTLMANHVDYKEIRQRVKNIPDGWETCCIQMSYALNNSGAPIPMKKGMIGLQSGNQNFIIRVSTMRDYLNEDYEEDNYTGSTEEMKAEIEGRRGIIAFGDRHIDLWTGSNIHRPHMYILSALWEAESTLQEGIHFWEVDDA